MCERAKEVAGAYVACGWVEYKNTANFVYFRGTAVRYTVAVCKRTGHYDYYPLRWIEISVD